MPEVKSTPFENAGCYLIGLLLLAILGFWNSYFSKVFYLPEDFNGYFHFHALMAGIWLVVLIIQPILIKRRQWKIHRQVGTLAHILMALFYVSVILLTHHQLSLQDKFNPIAALIPFKDLTILSVAYFIAIKYRKTVGIHARGMIATGIVFIEPALIRAIGTIFPSLGNRYLWTIAIIYTLLISLMVLGRKYNNGQWVFPLILLMYMVVHSIIIFRLPIGFFESFARWFASLPLT